ncbi:MAG: hypothetical protein F6K24_17445 [Okeania sp. SIO2D1]|nr:hypothetical protein [Okeania sp. SIO2D1]
MEVKFSPVIKTGKKSKGGKRQLLNFRKYLLTFRQTRHLEKISDKFSTIYLYILEKSLVNLRLSIILGEKIPSLRKNCKKWGETRGDRPTSTNIYLPLGRPDIWKKYLTNLRISRYGSEIFICEENW